MPESIRPLPVKHVSDRPDNESSVRPVSERPSSSDRWGGQTKMGMGEVTPSSARNWGGTTKSGIGHTARRVAGLTTQRMVRMQYVTRARTAPERRAQVLVQPNGNAALGFDDLKALWSSLPLWGASVLLASSFAFALGALFALVITR